MIEGHSNAVLRCVDHIYQCSIQCLESVALVRQLRDNPIPHFPTRSATPAPLSIIMLFTSSSPACLLALLASTTLLAAAAPTVTEGLARRSTVSNGVRCYCG